jgi:hypothetical protein
MMRLRPISDGVRRPAPPSTGGNTVPAPSWVRTTLALALLCQGLCGATASPSLESTRQHWSFQPLKRPAKPTVVQKSWPRTDLDPFILARLEQAGSTPLAAADKQTLIRRATFDVLGLPPTTEEVRSFLADDSPEAFAKVVDRLLDSPHYGEHWGRHWLDVVRYADTAGETADYPVPVAWRYRNYVIQAFNTDKPYDEFLREQIAGDILGQQGPRDRYRERITATGYLAISRRFGFDSENYHHLTIQDTIDNLGQTALGLTLGCARCHDHKYDPVSMADYYGLYGIFDSSRYAFPGSEQKQRYRAMAPLMPPEEAQASWTKFDERVASLLRKLERNKQPGAPGVLRSLADMDGDFEMQAIAAGGSRGVLVAPWVYEGAISVTREAQSPLGNLYPLGKAGVSLPSGTNHYAFGQSIYPSRTHEQGGRLHFNVDFRVAAPDSKLPGRHRIWLGSRTVRPSTTSAAHGEPHPDQASTPQVSPDSPAFELFISATTLALRHTEPRQPSSLRVEPADWHNLQLTLDLGGRTVSGRLCNGTNEVPIPTQPFLTTWNGSLNFIEISSESATTPATPPLDVDNIGIRETPIPSIVEAKSANTGVGEPTVAALEAEIVRRSGMDGGFEFQSPDTPPARPWHPGPKSLVKITKAAQSPYTHLFPAGKLGLYLPGGEAYNGFGQTLTNTWKASTTDRVRVAFDFRTHSPVAAEGTWRMYVGHGAGPGPALELFFNDRQFYPRNGDSRTALRRLTTNTWYHVQVELQLASKTYRGWIGTPSDRTEFQGSLATAWDGVLDYTFIDSYGHIGGNKPAVEVDNYVIREEPLPGWDASAVAQLAHADERDTIQQLKRRLEALNLDLENARKELNATLAEGPGEMTYAVVEATPRNARIHLRGEQDKLGAEVPRGFLKILGGDVIPEQANGSGRLELAGWVTRPENPLTPRVMANRIWQYHFGRGLVSTPNDFGLRGQPPSHPELLDYLAMWFLESGWSIKAMHRLIMNSATYQQRAAVGPNELYAGYTRQRLSAESLRDSILKASGELDETPGEGHPFPTPIGWGFSQHGPFSGTYDHNRRSIYLMTQRIKRHPFLALFDGADPNGSTPTRSISTVPTQALYFMNDPFVHDKARKLAERLQRSTPAQAEQVKLAFQWTLGRPPAAEEGADAADFLEAYRTELRLQSEAEAQTTALAAFARTLFASNEFLHID